MVTRVSSNLAMEAHDLLVAEHVDGRLHECAAGADLAFYENPRYSP